MNLAAARTKHTLRSPREMGVAASLFTEPDSVSVIDSQDEESSAEEGTGSAWVKTDVGRGKFALQAGSAVFKVTQYGNSLNRVTMPRSEVVVNVVQPPGRASAMVCTRAFNGLYVYWRKWGSAEPPIMSLAPLEMQHDASFAHSTCDQFVTEVGNIIRVVVKPGGAHRIVQHVDGRTGVIVQQAQIQTSERVASTTAGYALMQTHDARVLRVESGQRGTKTLTRGHVLGPIVQSPSGERLAFVVGSRLWVTRADGESWYDVPSDTYGVFVERFHEDDFSVLVREVGGARRAWYVAMAREHE